MATDDPRVEAAVSRARELLADADRLAAHAPAAERRRTQRVAAMLRSRAFRDFVMTLTDEVARIEDPRRAARRFAALVGDAPADGLSPADRFWLHVGTTAARIAPSLVMPQVVRRIRREVAGLVVRGDDRTLARHLAARRAAGFGCNVNVLGEAVLSDAEAERRLDAVIECLARDDVDHVSVKISSITANVDALAFDDTVDRVSDALRRLYSAAAAHTPPKFVNLDMEEYRDFALSLTAFTGVLSEPAFTGLDAGIVVQAYLPDALDAARDLCDWARARYQRAGTHIKVRVVKGANLAMEAVDAELHGWPVATYPSKAAVDANFKAVIDLLLDERNDPAVRVGLASHNIFDLAWGLVLADGLRSAGRPERIDFEMLDGMASPQAEALRERAGSVLLYTPVVKASDFTAAIAYLVRRFDENTAPENYLARVFDIAPDNEVFADEAAKFRTSVLDRAASPTGPRRIQDRGDTVAPVPLDAPFTNEPDTDFTLAANRAWARAIVERPPPAAASDRVDARAADAAVARGGGAQAAWEAAGAERRADVVNRVGDVFARRRADAIATMMHDADKTVRESDPEVSEAIDFARYYARTALAIDARHSSPLGTVVVAPPWNFPFAIPAGGALAALAAGNPVILKPAPQSRATAQLVAECCWEAGVPRDVLQFLPCDDDDAGQHLVAHPEVAAVVLTGAHATAQRFLDRRPSLQLHAETSGKNAMVISATADVDEAIRDLVHSAFGHSGQKCSAASLALVEASLYDDTRFLERLRDAVLTLRVGPATDLRTDVGPLIEPPSDVLRRGLTGLDAGESWLVEPRPVGDGGRAWSPGVRIGVKRGSWYATHECFGPVLGVVRVRGVDEALDIQNASAFGLTAGLHSLDEDEIERWCDGIEAGNAYVNRVTTGAIVNRQPFGGWKRSAVGPTAKAGGPHYVASLRRWHDDESVTIEDAARGYRSWTERVGRVEQDPNRLHAEANVYRYRPLRGVALRVDGDTDTRAVALARAAADAAGVRLTVSDGGHESEDAFALRLGRLHVDRLRCVAPVSNMVLRAAHANDIAVDPQPPVAHADAEMWRWWREQVVSRTLHRHGHLIAPHPLLLAREPRHL